MLNVGTNFLIQAVERLGLVEHPSHSDGISSKTPDGDMELRGRNRTWRATSPEELAEGKTAIVDLEYVHVTRVKKPEDQADCRRREQSTMSMEEFRKYRIEVTDFAYTRDGPSRKVDKFTDHWTPLDELEAKEHCNVDFAQVQNASLKKQGHWVARPRKAESMPTAEEVKESEADRNGVSKLAESNRVAHLFMAACDLRIEEEEGLLVFHVPVDAQDKEVESRKDSWRIVLASKLVSRRTSTSSSATDTRTSSPPPSSSRPDDNSSRAKPRRCPPPVLSIIHRNREHRTPLRSFAHLPAGASPSLQMYPRRKKHACTSRPDEHSSLQCAVNGIESVEKAEVMGSLLMTIRKGHSPQTMGKYICSRKIGPRHFIAQFVFLARYQTEILRRAYYGLLAMSTRKRKQEAEEEEELQALPSDESEEEEEYIESDGSAASDVEDDGSEAGDAAPKTKKRKTAPIKAAADDDAEEEEEGVEAASDEEDEAAVPAEDDEDDEADPEAEVEDEDADADADAQAEKTVRFRLTLHSGRQLTAGQGPTAAAKARKGKVVPKEASLDEVDDEEEE
ncbi:hypothetical protein BJ546DRAFT_946158 [Cryomyces antarcticus]